jgi:hypothetical protein
MRDAFCTCLLIFSCVSVRKSGWVNGQVLRANGGFA